LRNKKSIGGSPPDGGWSRIIHGAVGEIKITDTLDGLPVSAPPNPGGVQSPGTYLSV
jgi:hypothetical protein